MKQNIAMTFDDPIRNAYGDAIKSVEDIESIVPSEDQYKFLDSLKNRVNDQCFFFKVDLHHWTIENAVGVEQWLLYRDFDIDIYHQSMEPKYEISQYLHARVLLELLTHGKIKNIQFGKPVGCFLQTLKTSGVNNKPQKNILVKRSLYPFGYNKKFEVFEYVNFFQIIGESCRISPSFQYIKDESNLYYDGIMTTVKKHCMDKYEGVILSSTGISKNDFEMIKYGIEFKKSDNKRGYTNYLVDRTGREKNTVSTAIKRLLIKINNKFNINLKSFPEVVDFFLYIGFLG